jgi:magnesium-transporting ATPase (P-type)
MPRWSVISNALITLMFVGFATMVVVRNFFPEGITEVDGRIVNVTTPAFVVLALITLIVLGLRLRSQKIEAVDETDTGGIPWDFIAVLITGLIMLGLGIGFMAYINAAPA